MRGLCQRPGRAALLCLQGGGMSGFVTNLSAMNLNTVTGNS